ncbi:MAG: Sip1-related alpha-galactosidase [Clostridiales bacterium]|nr:Sip1-related alpha-galactosidase [Clostridiales bacterium]
MFLLKNVGGKIDIYHDGNLLIKGIAPVVNIDDIQIRPLLETAGKDIFTCEDSKRGLKLQLAFNKKDDVIYLEVEAYVENGSFAPNGGITLEVEDILNFKESMAVNLFKDWWTRPCFVRDFRRIPKKTQALNWTDGSNYYSILTVCSGNCKTDLEGADNKLRFSISTCDTGHNHYKTFSFILGAGDDPFSIQEDMAAAAFDSLNVQGKVREKRHYPEVFKYFGWCSWDAFYHEVNEKGIIDKAEEFKKKGFPVRWFIIDDGWSETKDNKLMSFDEDKDKFPHGFKWLMSKLKDGYGLSWIGVWQAFEGYWIGINPESNLCKEYSHNLYKTKKGALTPYPDEEKAFGFWNAWHSSLREKGVDFVKVDNQSSFKYFIKDNMDICTSSASEHAALEASVGLNFDGTIINCMGMGPEDMWNRPYTALNRNSDDFFPKTENSFREHALENAYNSYITGNIFWGDWDMFWTEHPQGVNNAVLRALSGGPVYVSDEVGKTDASILWPLIFSDGEVLRCDRPGMPTVDCLYKNPQEEGVPLKVWNKSGQFGVIGSFNINKTGKMVYGIVRPSDVYGIKGDKFILYEYFSKKVTMLDKDEDMDISLPEDAVRLYIVSPVNNGFAAIGNIDKYISPGVIKHISISEDEINIWARDAGNFGFVSFKEPVKIAIDGVKSSFNKKDGDLYMVDCGSNRNSQINIYFK